jgi:hypothetical protein
MERTSMTKKKRLTRDQALKELATARKHLESANTRIQALEAEVETAYSRAEQGEKLHDELCRDIATDIGEIIVYIDMRTEALQGIAGMLEKNAAGHKVVSLQELKVLIHGALKGLLRGTTRYGLATTTLEAVERKG